MIRRHIAAFVSLTLLSCSLTLVYLSMRAVMEIGGACASGGPYEIANPCPEGVPLLMVGGIFVGIASVFVFSATASGIGAGYGSLAFLAWPALFLSLGWNFFDYGVSPPDGSGLVFGWVFCGVVFWLMGGLPLLPALRPSVIKKVLWPEGAPRVHQGPPLPRPVRPSPAPRPPAPRSSSGDVVSALERLAKLHADGAIDDAEYERAKSSVLGGGV